MALWERLSVNVLPETEAALERIVRCEGVTLTEALRRLVAAGDAVYQAVRVDGAELAARRDGTTERLILAE